MAEMDSSVDLRSDDPVVLETSKDSSSNEDGSGAGEKSTAGGLGTQVSETKADGVDTPLEAHVTTQTADFPPKMSATEELDLSTRMDALTKLVESLHRTVNESFKKTVEATVSIEKGEPIKTPGKGVVDGDSGVGGNPGLKPNSDSKMALDEKFFRRIDKFEGDRASFRSW